VSINVNECSKIVVNDVKVTLKVLTSCPYCCYELFKNGTNYCRVIIIDSVHEKAINIITDAADVKNICYLDGLKYGGL